MKDLLSCLSYSSCSQSDSLPKSGFPKRIYSLYNTFSARILWRILQRIFNWHSILVVCCSTSVCINSNTLLLDILFPYFKRYCRLLSVTNCCLFRYLHINFSSCCISKVRLPKIKMMQRLKVRKKMFWRI